MNVIIINGAIGSGKTALKNIASDYLKGNCGKTAAIDLDELYKNIDSDFSSQENELKANWLLARKSLAVLTDFYCKNNVNTVFVVGPFFTTEEIKAFTNNINSYVSIHVFTLKPSDEVLKQRILKRGDTGKSESWIDNYLRNVNSYYSSDMDIIDNSDLTPKQTLDWIVEKVFS